MFLFAKLYLAHLIGDFILQFEELYRLKTRRVLGHVLHVVIHFVLLVLFSWPYLGYVNLWICICLIALIHLAQDLVKYSLSEKHPRFRFIFFVGDQIIHFLIVALVFLFPVHELALGFPDSKWLNFFYTDTRWTLAAQAFILTTFAGSYVMNAYRRNFVDAKAWDYYITSFEMAHSIIERTVITGLFIFAPNIAFAFLGSFIGLLRLPFKKLRNRNDFLVSFIYALAIGLIYRSLIL